MVVYQFLEKFPQLRSVDLESDLQVISPHYLIAHLVKKQNIPKNLVIHYR